MELRNAIYNLVEYFTQYELSDQARKLVLHYFNDSKAGSAYERALEAISRYYANEIPPYEEMPGRLQSMMQVLKREADAWDAE